MTDDLIERLEAWAEDIQLDGYAKGADLDLKEAAARIRELEQGVAVKPLEWRDSYGVLRAETPFGDYMVTGKIVKLPVTSRAERVCENPQEAAQADYEARIRSTLTPSPVTVQEAARVLLAEWEEGEGLLGELCCYSLDEEGMISPDIDGDWVPFSNVHSALSALAGQGGE